LEKLIDKNWLYLQSAINNIEFNIGKKTASETTKLVNKQQKPKKIFILSQIEQMLERHRHPLNSSLNHKLNVAPLQTGYRTVPFRHELLLTASCSSSRSLYAAVAKMLTA
jgi:hypothetical protein